MEQTAELRQLFHRLNNQLGIILAHAELLEKKAADETSRSRATQVVSSVLDAMGTAKEIRMQMGNRASEARSRRRSKVRRRSNWTLASKRLSLSPFQLPDPSQRILEFRLCRIATCNTRKRDQKLPLSLTIYARSSISWRLRAVRCDRQS